MLPLAVLLTLAPSAPPAARTALGEVVGIERFAVPAVARVSVDALAGTVTLRGVKRAPTTSSICPRVDDARARHGVVELRCRTHHLEARIVHAPKGRRAARTPGALLEIVELSAAPQKDGEGSLPLFAYDQEEIGAGGACPGDTPASRGECALDAGSVSTAVKEFTLALEGANAPFAALRLGDIAASLDDIDRATRFWDRVGPRGSLARLAAARLCEYVGGCLERTEAGVTFAALDDAGLPAPLADELVLRHARVLAYDGRLGDALSLLVDRTHDGRAPCARATPLCRRLARAGLESDSDADGAAALALALGLTRKGEPDIELVRLAAERAAAFGAPGFAANLLASSTAGAPAAAVEEPLLRSAELYLASGDAVRAATVMRFLRAHLKHPRDRRRIRDITARIRAAGEQEGT